MALKTISFSHVVNKNFGSREESKVAGLQMIGQVRQGLMSAPQGIGNWPCGVRAPLGGLEIGEKLL